MIRLAMLLALTAPIFGCGQATSPTENAPPAEESSLSGVWEKARQRGVTFRAVGQEPGWLLEISAGNNILLETDYGQQRATMPYVEPLVFAGEDRTRFVLQDSGVLIEIYGDHCTDTMSGEVFERSVIVQRDATRLTGCGRTLSQ